MDSPMMNFENRPTDAALAPKAQKEFEKIFCQWMDEEWNQERLLLGGTGNLVTLAARLVAYLADPEDKNYSRRLNSKRAAMHMHSSSEKEGGDGTTCNVVEKRLILTDGLAFTPKFIGEPNHSR